MNAFIETLLDFLVPFAIVTMFFCPAFLSFVYYRERRRHKRTLDELRHSNNAYKKEVKAQESIIQAYERYVKKLEERLETKTKSSSQELS